MSDYEETNVRLPPCAFDALAAVASRRNTSRDETVRQLLTEHVERQEQQEPDGRLTHISTVLRYPPPPQWRGALRADRPLRLRVAPGLIPRARAVSLRLPGQSQRAYRDYQGRLLTDAVMTAIALEEAFSDNFLHGMRPLIRHRSALGLWALTVAATSTAPETDLYKAAETRRAAPGHSPSHEEAAAQRRLLLVAEALKEDVSWHAPVRFQVAASIARDLLTGSNAAANERMLYKQRSDWEKLRKELRNHGPIRSRYQGMNTTYDCLGEYCSDGVCAGHKISGYDWTGRGATAVWRAERRVELQDFEDWLIRRGSHDPAERQMQPPGWMIRTPKTWHAHIVSTATEAVPEPYAKWVAEGKVLAFPYQEKQAVWPVIHRHGPPGTCDPAPGITPLANAAKNLRPDQITGFIEAVLVDWDGDHDESTIRIAMDLPVDKARTFGFLAPEEEQHVRAQARARTLQAMDDIIDNLPDAHRHLRAQLEQAKGNARLFARLTHPVRINGRPVRFWASRATWPWPGRSVVDELQASTRSTDLLEWLATQAYKTSSLVLEQSMEEEWHRAFDLYGRRV
ncbi:hypothetical protein ABZX98_32890 [Streptomyces sp. NPDC002992]|uniref:hypothetical protein n=1 Tax=Streptomyces sp. NPDC002992 TaxID=3154273 RepID=UPI0033A83B3E